MTTAVRNRQFHGRTVGLLVAVGVLVTLGLLTPAAAAPVHKATLIMSEFRFDPPVLHLKVGEQVVLTIRNTGAVEHEWAIGRGLVNNQSQKGYRQDLFAILKFRVTGRQYELERVSAPTNGKESEEGEYAEMISTEVDVQAGGAATLRFTVPASARGEWEMGCFLPGHYESGMHGRLLIE